MSGLLGRLGGTAGGQEPDEQVTFVGLDTTRRGLGAVNDTA
jgi:hypothetical protein